MPGPWAPISVAPYATRLYLWQALVLLAFFGLVLRLATTRTRVELLVKTAVWCGFIQATVGLMLFANGASYTLLFGQVQHEVAKGTFYNRNHFAGYLEMTLALGIGLMIAKLEDSGARTWRQRIVGWLAVLLSDKARLRLMLIVMVVGLISSRSRMGNGAFMIGLLITGVMAIALARQATRSTIIFLASIVVLDVVILGSVVGLDTVAKRIEETNMRNRPVPQSSTGASGSGAANASRQGEQSLQERLETARLTTAIVRDFPVLGTGGGTFFISFATYQPLRVKGFFEHAHNDFAEFAAETGVAGFAILAAIVAMSAIRALRILVVRRDQFARGMAFGALMGMVNLMIHSIVDFNLQLPANAMMFLVVLALPYLVASRDTSAKGA
jgi:O-antigen ligase